MERSTIKQWAEQDRPREKMLAKGRQALTDAELLALILGSGNERESAVELGRRMLSAANNDIAKLSRLSLKDLMAFRGVGSAKAVAVAAALELGRRRNDAHPPERNKIQSSYNAYMLFRPLLTDLPHEEFYAMLLDRGNAVLHIQQISKGGVSSTVIDPRIVFKVALEHHASGIILAHNHPSGTLLASDDDIRVTKRLCEGGKLLEIKVLDHLIITDSGYRSFADSGELPE
jgi:DNA repair protein RadC